MVYQLQQIDHSNDVNKKSVLEGNWGKDEVEGENAVDSLKVFPTYFSCKSETAFAKSESKKNTCVRVCHVSHLLRNMQKLGERNSAEGR